MKLFKFRTKLETAGTIFLVAILLTTAVFSIRIITDSSDNIETFIRCSNGNYYPVTTSDLQAAIWSQNDTGGEIKVGADLTITAAINLVNNTILDFQWHNITLTDSAGFHMIQIGDGTAPITNVEIMHGRFDGNRANQASLKHCIYVQDKCQRINIHNNYLTGWYGKGVAIEGGAGADNCYYISVCDNIMDDFQQGVDADGIDFDQVTWGVIEGNQIKEAGDDGIDVGAGAGIDIIGNVVRDCVNGVELYATKATVVGNTCDDLDYYGIVLDGCKVTTVNGNYIYYAGHHGIRMLYAVSCSIVGNTLWRCSQSLDNTYDNIHLESKNGNHSVNNTIVGNTILEDGTNKAKCGINESDTNQDYNLIFGNTIDGPVTIAINKSGVHSIIGYNLGYNYSNFNHFGDTTNYMDVNETGFLTLHGDARVERHADINAGTWIKKGLADPATSTEGLFCTLDFDKATNETVYYTFHIPWRHCNNTDMEVSVYWFHDNNAADANKKVMWAVDYVSIEPGETVDATNTTITQLSAGNHNTDAGELIYTTFTTKIIAGNLANHDNMGIRFYRVGTDGSDDLDEDARMISVHLHFTMDKLGEPIG